MPLCGVIPAQLQDFTLLLDEPQEIPLYSSLRPVQVPVNSSTPLSCTTARITRVRAEGARCPTAQVISENLKQHWPQHLPLAYSASGVPPTRLCAADHNPLGLDFKPVFKPLDRSSN